MGVKLTICPDCNTPVDYDPMIVKFNPLRELQCWWCGKSFKPPMSTTQKGSDNQRRSKAQEKRAAKRYKAKAQPASGALPGAKSDFRDPGRIRGECKFTRARSFSLKLDELLKLESEAAGTETPLFEVEFQGVSPKKQYVVLPAHTFRALQEELDGLRQAHQEKDT